MRAETLANGADDVVKVRAHAVHLVDKANARDAILVGLAPDGFRLRLHAGDRVENADGAVENAQGALDLHREIHVAGRINNVDAVLFVVAGPTGGGGGAGDRNAALALLLHPVHGGRAFVHRTNLVGDTRIEQDALGRRGLSGVDVRHNPDIAGVFEFKYSAHSPLTGPFLPGSCCDRFTHGYHQVFLNFKLPAIVGESLVGFGHAVHIFLLLDSAAAGICRVDQFIGELFHHGLAGAFARILQEPANGQGLPAEGIHFHRHLVVGAADAPGLDLDERLQILDRLLENLEGIVVSLLGDLVHRAVEHALRGALLAFPHHRADELLNDVASVDRIQRLSPPADYSFTRHFVSCSFEIFGQQLRSIPHRPEILRRGLLRMPTLIGSSLGCRPASLGALRAVLRAALLAVFNAGGVERAAHNVVANTRKILHTAAAHQHDRVLLQVVADTWDVRGDLNGVGQADASHLAQRGVRFLRRLRVYADAYAALFRATHQRRRFGLRGDSFSSHPDKLRKRRHSRSSFSFGTRTFTAGGEQAAHRAQTNCTHSRYARRLKRESTQTGSKVYCESGETSKKLRTHSKRENYAPGFESERLTRLFGVGATFRPPFCPIPSYLFRDRRIPIKPATLNLP